jgi:hypothetical protein
MREAIGSICSSSIPVLAIKVTSRLRVLKHLGLIQLTHVLDSQRKMREILEFEESIS